MRNLSPQAVHGCVNVVKMKIIATVNFHEVKTAMY